jgi:hypothetical protein
MSIELSPYYLHMKPQGKLLFSKLMRRAIWRWIEAYPSQFAEVCASDARLLAGSEVLFDMCSSTADNSRKKAALWPLQTILLVLSPEFLMQAFLDAPPTLNRRANFLSLLKKSLQTTRNVDIAAVCYVDLCKAAMYVPPNNESVLRSIAADVEADLKEKVWDFTKPPSSESTLAILGYTIDQQALTTDFLLARIRLLTEDTLKTIVPSCVEENVPILFKLSLVKACLIIAQEENNLPWNPTLSSLSNGLCTPLRKLFLQTIQNDVHISSTTANKKRDTYSTHNSRVELLLDLLRLYRLDSKLALLGTDQDRVEQNSAYMVGLATLFQHPVQTIRQGAAELLVKMHQSDLIAFWGPNESILPSFWKISSPVIFSLARQMMDNKSNDDNLKALLDLLIKLFKKRYTFLKNNQVQYSGTDKKKKIQGPPIDTNIFFFFFFFRLNSFYLILNVPICGKDCRHLFPLKLLY